MLQTIGSGDSLEEQVVGGNLDAGETGIYHRGYRARWLIYGGPTVGQGL